MTSGVRSTGPGGWVTKVAGIVCLWLVPGCGPGLYLIDVLPASAAVHGAEQSGAAEWSPYEYWTAREYLEKAAEEANEGNYQDAIRFAERARDMGERAQRGSSEHRRAASDAAAGRPPRPARTAASTAGASR